MSWDEGMERFGAQKKEEFIVWTEGAGGNRSTYREFVVQDALKHPDDYRKVREESWVDAFVDKTWQPEIWVKKATEHPLFTVAGIDLSEIFTFPDKVPGGFTSVHSTFGTVGQYERMVDYRVTEHERKGLVVASMVLAKKALVAKAGGDRSKLVSDLADPKTSKAA